MDKPETWITWLLMLVLVYKVNQVDEDLGGACGPVTTAWGVTDALTTTGGAGTFSGLSAYRPRAGRYLSAACGCGGMCGSCQNG